MDQPLALCAGSQLQELGTSLLDDLRKPARRRSGLIRRSALVTHSVIYDACRHQLPRSRDKMGMVSLLR